MMAYVLISLKDNTEHRIRDKLLKRPEVNEINILFGEWDLITKLEVSSTDELAKFVSTYIRKEPQVNLTSTMIVAK